MVSLRSNEDKRVSRPTYRKVLSIREKEAAVKKKEKAAQQEARKKLQAAKKAQAQLPAVEVVDEDDGDDDNGDELPIVVPVLPPVSTLQKRARATIPAKPARVELSYQLGAFVIEKEVYVNANMITIASFDYNSLCLKADDTT